jgi:hypothetical protein
VCRQHHDWTFLFMKGNGLSHMIWNRQRHECLTSPGTCLLQYSTYWAVFWTCFHPVDFGGLQNTSSWDSFWPRFLISRMTPIHISYLGWNRAPFLYSQFGIPLIHQSKKKISTKTLFRQIVQSGFFLLPNSQWLTPKCIFVFASNSGLNSKRICEKCRPRGYLSFFLF